MRRKVGYNFKIHKDIDKLRKILDRYFQRAKNMLSGQDPAIKPRLVFENTSSNKILVSVVTPVYNAETFLEDVHRSLENQTISRHVQWVVVNDGSKDGSLQKLLELGKRTKLGSIKVLDNPGNLGASVALHNAIQHTDSEVVAWVSADDAYVSREKLEQDTNLIEQGYPIVFSVKTVIGQDPRNIFAEVELNPKKLSYFLTLPAECKILWLSFRNFLNGSSIVFSRRTYNQVGGFDINLFNVDGDFDLICKMLIASGGKMAFSDTIAFLRSHGEQTSKNLLEMYVGINLTRIRFTRFLSERTIVGRDGDIVFEMMKEAYFGGLGSLVREGLLRCLKAFLKRYTTPLRQYLFEKRKWLTSLDTGGNCEIIQPYYHCLLKLGLISHITTFYLGAPVRRLRPSQMDLQIFEEIYTLAEMYSRSESFSYFLRNYQSDPERNDN